MNFDVQPQFDPRLILVGLGLLGLLGGGLVLSVAALIHAPLRDLLWPRGRGPEPLPLGVAARALVTWLLCVIGVKLWRSQFPPATSDWALPLWALVGQGMMLVCVVAAVFTPRRGPEEAFERLGLSMPRARHVLSGVGAWVCSLWLVAAAVAVSALFHGLLFGRGLPAQETMRLIQGANRGPRLVIALMTVLVAPMVEEVMFRGLLFRALRARTGFWGAGLISAALFALIHLEPLHCLQLTALGLALAWVYERTGSLWPAVFLHTAQNLLAMVVVYAASPPA